MPCCLAICQTLNSPSFICLTTHFNFLWFNVLIARYSIDLAKFLERTLFRDKTAISYAVIYTFDYYKKNNQKIAFPQIFSIKSYGQDYEIEWHTPKYFTESKSHSRTFLRRVIYQAWYIQH